MYDRVLRVCLRRASNALRKDGSNLIDINSNVTDT